MTDNKQARKDIFKKRNDAIKALCKEAGYTSLSNFLTCVLNGEVELPKKPNCTDKRNKV